MRAEHVEAMERTEALMREHTKPGHNFGHSIWPIVVGVLILAGIVGFTSLMNSIQSSSVRFAFACTLPLGIVLLLALVSFLRRRLRR